jgi:hypothetical protein
MNIRRRFASASVVLLLALATAACGGDDYEPSGGTGAGDESTYQSGGESGEIWQWALGRRLDDPALQPYTASTKGDAAHVQSEGFTLHFDAAMAVYSVSLYNDESALGFGSENTFAAYPGELPGGLSWSMSAADVVERLGEPDTAYTTGYGVEMSFTYRDVDGYAIEIRLAARHQADLWPSPMHVIDVNGHA